MKINNRKMFSLAFILFSALASISVTSALTISPAKAELTADPGETITSTFIIINEQDTEQTFYTSVENFESSGKAGIPNFTNSKEGLPSWTKVDEKVVLKKGERLKIPYSVAVPKDADAGGHFAAIFLSTSSTTAGVGSKLGMLVFLKVTGVTKKIETPVLKRSTSTQALLTINATTTEKDIVTINSNLKYGQRNSEIFALQDFLIDKGFLNGNSSGFFGLLTFKAVKAYQKSVGINPTGYVGLLTRQKINSEIIAEVGSSIKAEQQEVGTSTQSFNNSTTTSSKNGSEDRKTVKAFITTSRGGLEIELSNNAPNTVKNFIQLANSKFYDGVRFHRVIKNFMIQTGDPLSKDASKQAMWGTGGPGYKFQDELTGTEQYPLGTIAMANSGPNTNGSQFFIITANSGYPLPPNYTVFGKVTKGIETALAIQNVQTDRHERPIEDVFVQKIEIQGN